MVQIQHPLPKKGYLMADFCRQCSLEEFLEDFHDFIDLCDPGEILKVICEGCGPTWIDHNGVCRSCVAHTRTGTVAGGQVTNKYL